MVNNWPPDYLEVNNARYKANIELAYDKDLQADAMRIYADDPLVWIADFCITYDPRNKPPLPRVLPFILFPKQIEFIGFLTDCIQHGESGLVEKARDMGASWLCASYSVWMWLFQTGSAIGWGSRKEAYVDKKGDPKAIFPKIRQTLEHLPQWMMPRGFDMDTHAPYMRIINPVNGSTITGEAGNSIGRGGRTTVYFKDESAHYEQPESIEAALGDNTDVQIDISSVNGSANVFYRRRMAGQLWTPTDPLPKGITRVFIFDWRDHPGKTQDWYDLRRHKAESEGLLHMFAQEVDRDYSSAIQKTVIMPAWARAAIDAHIKLGFDDSGEKTCGQDVADGGNDKNATAIKHGVVLKFAKDWGGDSGEAAKIAIPHCIEWSVTSLSYDSPGVGSGFKVGINALREKGALPNTIKVQPWNPGGAVMDPDKRIIPNDRESPTNKDFFDNRKAQAWWSTRTRFYKTYRAITYGDKYPPAELISLDSTLPQLHQIIMELCQPVYDTNKAGKLVIDKTPEGSVSPNIADAINICYNSQRRISILDVLG